MFSQLELASNVRYGFSKREDGSMNRISEIENRTRYFQDLGFESNRVVTADLTHGTNILLVKNDDGGTMPGGTDGLITKEKNLLLTATGADCFILYFYDAEKEAVGIAHVGWRGVLSGMPQMMIGRMKDSFGSSPGAVFVGIGPGIRQCHFEISPGDRVRYGGYLDFILEKEDRVFVDLAGIIKGQVESSGVRSDHIEDCGMCTFCEKEKYFSYRRDKPKEVQPMVGYISLV